MSNRFCIGMLSRANSTERSLDTFESSMRSLLRSTPGDKQKRPTAVLIVKSQLQNFLKKRVSIIEPLRTTSFGTSEETKGVLKMIRSIVKLNCLARMTPPTLFEDSLVEEEPRPLANDSYSLSYTVKVEEIFMPEFVSRVTSSETLPIEEEIWQNQRTSRTLPKGLFVRGDPDPQEDLETQQQRVAKIFSLERQARLNRKKPVSTRKVSYTSPSRPFRHTVSREIFIGKIKARVKSGSEIVPLVPYELQRILITSTRERSVIRREPTFFVLNKVTHPNSISVPKLPLDRLTYSEYASLRESLATEPGERVIKPRASISTQVSTYIKDTRLTGNSSSWPRPPSAPKRPPSEQKLPEIDRKRTQPSSRFHLRLRKTTE